VNLLITRPRATAADTSVKEAKCLIHQIVRRFEFGASLATDKDERKYYNLEWRCRQIFSIATSIPTIHPDVSE